MKVSKKSEYAVCALVEMVLRTRAGGEWHQISQIAASTGIPEKFLEQILLNLKKSGLLQSRRGVEGGYCLNVSAEELSLDRVICLLDGANTKETPEVSGPAARGARGIFIRCVEQAEEAALNVLQSTTVAVLADQVQALRSKERGNLEYQI